MIEGHMLHEDHLCNQGHIKSGGVLLTSTASVSAVQVRACRVDLLRVSASTPRRLYLPLFCRLSPTRRASSHYRPPTTLQTRSVRRTPRFCSTAHLVCASLLPRPRHHHHTRSSVPTCRATRGNPRLAMLRALCQPGQTQSYLPPRYASTAYLHSFSPSRPPTSTSTPWRPAPSSFSRSLTTRQTQNAPVPRFLHITLLLNRALLETRAVHYSTVPSTSRTAPATCTYAFLLAHPLVLRARGVFLCKR